MIQRHFPFAENKSNQRGNVICREFNFAKAGVIPETGLLVAISNTTLGEIVWREFHGDFVTGQNADAVTAEFSSEVGENGAILGYFDTKQATWEFFDYGSGYFNTIFFAH